MGNVLKCDADGCGHLERVEAIVEEDIGRPCSKCGANLLTREDFEVWKREIEPGLRVMEALGLVKNADPGTGGALMFVHYHDGVTTVQSDRKHKEAGE